MDNNDSNLKSQTGGLKLMTVFIAVLALHVVVIGGFTVYHLMSGGSTDADLTSTDKNHKGSTSDITTAEVTQTDKSATTAPTEVATIPTTTVTPASAPAPTGDTSSPAIATSSTTSTTPAPAAAPATATTEVTTPAPTPAPAPAATVATPTVAPAPALTLNTPASSLASASVNTGALATPTPQTPTGPIQPDLAPPPDAAPVAISPMAPVMSPTAPLAAGPVHMPPANADASLVHHTHQQTYVVKITDSYKKIAHAHHVTVAQLKEANHIKGDVLHTGQKLIIPSQKSEVAESSPAATSTLSSAPTSTVASESTAPMTTGLTSTTMSETTVEHHHLYTVVKGDTLTKIAHRFKTTPSALMAANGITNPTKLTIGKKLRIPSRESRSASNTPAVTTPPSQVQAKGNGSAPTGQLATFRQ